MTLKRLRFWRNMRYARALSRTSANTRFGRRTRRGTIVSTSTAICLQDDRILDAVERAHSFIRLSPLMLYIAAHELVHVIRFERGEGNFDAPDDEKSNEEEKVHRITRSLAQTGHGFGHESGHGLFQRPLPDR